jgi:hypothetical protein
MFIDHRISESKANDFEDGRLSAGDLARDEALALIAWYPDDMNSVRAARLSKCSHVEIAASMLESDSIDYTYVANNGRTVTEELSMIHV